MTVTQCNVGKAKVVFIISGYWWLGTNGLKDSLTPIRNFYFRVNVLKFKNLQPAEIDFSRKFQKKKNKEIK